MKKFVSFLLAAVLLVSAIPTALATNDYTQGTQVVYTATGSEAYTITVPALLAPGSSGTVTLSGTWADNRIITVTADQTVTLKNSIKETDTKTLNVNFNGIREAGSNTGSQNFTESVSVAGIDNALFGTWSGTFYYDVEMVDKVQLITFTIDDTEYQAEAGMTWGEWIGSEYNYNNDDITIDNGVPKNIVGDRIYDETKSWVSADDEIIDGKNYQIGLSF